MFVLARVRPLALSLIVALAVVGAACSEEEPQGFTADSRSGFLAACTRPLEDTRLIGAICQCVFEETQAQLEFSRFRQIDETLVIDPEAGLPDDLLDVVANCVIDETGL